MDSSNRRSSSSLMRRSVGLGGSGGSGSGSGRSSSRSSSSSSHTSLVFVMQLLLLLSSPFLLLNTNNIVVQAKNSDRFNYDETIEYDDYNSYGPTNWDRIECSNKTDCEGWPDKWDVARGWSLDIDKHQCFWCPADPNTVSYCPHQTHHQSPIDLQRNRGLYPNMTSEARECIDYHLMEYRTSACSFDDLIEKRQFQIRRHALTINQPIHYEPERDRYELDCYDKVLVHRFGRIDWSWGFGEWFMLSHLDFHVPSEHTQDGHQYSAEVHLYHFYSIPGARNEMGTVSVFLEVYDDASDWDELNRVICAWRREEDLVRSECGLDPVEPPYPGCTPFTTSRRARDLRSETKTTTSTSSKSAHDVIMDDYRRQMMRRTNNATYQQRKKAQFHTGYDEDDIPPPDPKTRKSEWEEFVQSVYQNDRDKKTKKRQRGRELLNYDHVGPWHIYFPLIDCRTEYYFRYQGTQTIPPCYGPLDQDDPEHKGETNSWRVMKDPVRISQRQLDEMHRLLRERIAPIDDEHVPCQKDTAGKVDMDTGRVNVARPLQSNQETHYKVFCECKDWNSTWKEDKDWCDIKDIEERFYDHPYNFQTDGF